MDNKLTRRFENDKKLVVIYSDFRNGELEVIEYDKENRELSVYVWTSEQSPTAQGYDLMHNMKVEAEKLLSEATKTPLYLLFNPQQMKVGCSTNLNGEFITKTIMNRALDPKRAINDVLEELKGYRHFSYSLSNYTGKINV